LFSKKTKMQDNHTSLKILWMIPKWTFPVTDGARVATDSLIRNTVAAGADVDVLCLPQLAEMTEPELMKKTWGVKNVFIVPRPLPESGLSKKLYYLRQFLLKTFTPLTFSSFSDQRLQEKVRRIIQSQKYDYILLDGLHLGAALMAKGALHPSLTTSRVIYRAHNLEVDLWKKAYKEKKSPFLKLILYFQSRLVERFEKAIIDFSYGVAAIAQEDMVEIKKITTTKCELIPLGLNFDRPLEACLIPGVKFLFIGRLDWPPNRDALEWILKEVWPSVISNRPEAILKIVGSGNIEWVKKYQHLKGIELAGFVKTIKDAYEDCHFTIVPITYGSGTRIKVVEAFALGRRLISTKMGVQGADLAESDYINAETKEEWIKILSSIQLDKVQQDQLNLSRAVVAAKFDEKNIGARFYNWLKAIS